MEAALKGEKVILRPGGRREVVRIGWTRRWSDVRIAQVSGMAVNTVSRIRDELGLRGLELSEQLEDSSL